MDIDEVMKVLDGVSKLASPPDNPPPFAWTDVVVDGRRLVDVFTGGLLCKAQNGCGPGTWQCDGPVLVFRSGAEDNRTADNYRVMTLRDDVLTPVQHPHVWSDGRLCMGDAVDVTGALMQLNLNSIAGLVPEMQWPLSDCDYCARERGACGLCTVHGRCTCSPAHRCADTSCSCCDECSVCVGRCDCSICEGCQQCTYSEHRNDRHAECSCCGACEESRSCRACSICSDCEGCEEHGDGCICDPHAEHALCSLGDCTECDDCDCACPKDAEHTVCIFEHCIQCGDCFCDLGGDGGGPVAKVPVVPAPNQLPLVADGPVRDSAGRFTTKRLIQ